MSNYTIELRNLIDNNFDFGLTSADYPIFDESYRATLNSKILNHFKFREIGFETAELFKVYLNRTMNEIMPLYNQYYKSALITFNPLYNMDVSTTRNTTNSGTNSGSSTLETSGNGTNTSESKNDTTNTVAKNQTQNNKTAESTTPQSLLSYDDITGISHASKGGFENVVSNGNETTTIVGDIKDTTTNTTNGTNTSTNQNSINSVNSYSEHVIGSTSAASNSRLLNEFRSTFLNIDMMIIEELNDLFMGVY